MGCDQSPGGVVIIYEAILSGEESGDVLEIPIYIPHQAARRFSSVSEDEALKANLARLVTDLELRKRSLLPNEYSAPGGFTPEQKLAAWKQTTRQRPNEQTPQVRTPRPGPDARLVESTRQEILKPVLENVAKQHASSDKREADAMCIRSGTKNLEKLIRDYIEHAGYRAWSSASVPGKSGSIYTLLINLKDAPQHVLDLASAMKAHDSLWRTTESQGPLEPASTNIAGRTSNYDSFLTDLNKALLSSLPLAS
jgi:hypothetical protein